MISDENIDTALKIGLSALVGGVISLSGIVIAYFLDIKKSYRSYRQELKKARFNFKKEIVKIQESNKHEIEKLKITHKQENYKTNSAHKREKLLEILEQIEKFNIQEIKFWQLTVERLRTQIAKVPMLSNRLLEWNRLYADSSYYDLSNAEAKLVLLGEIGAADLVREYGNTLLKIRNSVRIEGEEIAGVTVPELVKFMETRNSLRQRIYRSLIGEGKDAEYIGYVDVNTGSDIKQVGNL